MPKGIYKRKPFTKKTREKMRLAHLGKKYKPMSEQGRKNIGKAHMGLPSNAKGKNFTKEKYPNYGMRGKHQSEKAKQQMRKPKSEEAKKNMVTFKKGNIPWNKYLTKETDERVKRNGEHVSIAVKGRVPWNKEKHGIYPEVYRKKIRLARLNQVFPTKDTSIELKVQGELSSRGIEFSKHYPIIGQPDIAFPDRKIAIFADGNYWHNRPEVKERDIKVNEALQNEGWTVLRFWEHDIKNNLQECITKIEEAIK